MRSPAGWSYPPCAESLAASEALRSSNGREACAVWRHADMTDSHVCTPLHRHTDSRARSRYAGMFSVVLGSSPHRILDAPGGVQEFYLTGTHLFTYAVLYDLAPFLAVCRRSKMVAMVTRRSRRARVFAGDAPCHGEDRRSASARFDALQSVIN
jgi:hypothetical protein